MTPKDAAVWKEIKATKLTDIAARAQDHNHWDADTTKRAVEWYRRYLFLCYRHKGPVLGIVPEADEIWHAHILFTDRYRDDCKRIFKRFLDHLPTTPRVTKTQQLLMDTTEDWYVEEFGESPPPLKKPCY